MYSREEINVMTDFVTDEISPDFITAYYRVVKSAVRLTLIYLNERGFLNRKPPF